MAADARWKEALAGLVLLGAGLGANALLQGELVAYRDARPPALTYVPSPRMARAASLGFSEVLADLYWLHSIQYFHREITREDRSAPAAPLYGPLADLVTELDPDFHAAHYYGSLLLSVLGRLGEARAVLEKGRRRHPDHAAYELELGKLLAFTPRQTGETREQVERRRAEGLQAFRRALAKKGLTPFDEQVIRRLLVDAGDWKIAFAYFARKYETERSRTLRGRYLEMLRRTALEPVLRRLRDDVRRWTAARGAPPRSLEELFAAPWARPVALEPAGARGGRLLYRTPPFGREPIADFRDTLWYDPASGSVRSEHLFRRLVEEFEGRVRRAQDAYRARTERAARSLEELEEARLLRTPPEPLWGRFRLDEGGRFRFEEGAAPGK